MKKIYKYFLFFSLLLFSSGCEATYELNISSSSLENSVQIKETKEVIEDINEDNDELREEYIQDIAHFERNSNLKREFLQNDNFYMYQYYQNVKKTNNLENKLIIDCYDQVSIEEDEHITITTSDYFKCFDEYPLLDNVVVRIKSDYKLISTNADLWGDYEYNWYINKDDPIHPIQLELEVEKPKNNNNFIIITLFLISVVTIIIVYTKRKYNRGY